MRTAFFLCSKGEISLSHHMTGLIFRNAAVSGIASNAPLDVVAVRNNH